MVQKSDPPAYKPGSYQELLPHAGAFNYLKENFSNAPSLDMSAASLNMLVRLMVAQVQECVFEKMTLLCAQHDFLSRLQLAQEAAKVSALGRRGPGGVITAGEAPSLVSRPTRRGEPAVTLSRWTSSIPTRGLVLTPHRWKVPTRWCIRQ